MTDMSLTKDTATAEKTPSQWWDVWYQFRGHKGAMAGLFFLTFITLFCALGPLLWSVDPTELDIRNKDVRPIYTCLLYTSPSPRDQRGSRMPSSA